MNWVSLIVSSLFLIKGGLNITKGNSTSGMISIGIGIAGIIYYFYEKSKR